MNAVTHFIANYREARALLAEGKTFHISGWLGTDIHNEEEFHRWFMKGLNRKINSHLVQQGRKWDWDYQTDLSRDQRTLHDITQKRARHYQFNTKEVRARFSHLLATYED